MSLSLKLVGLVAFAGLIAYGRIEDSMLELVGLAGGTVFLALLVASGRGAPLR